MLRRGGRIAGYLIHTPDGLSPRQLARAAELGPSLVEAAASPGETLRASGFTVLLLVDVTEEFFSTGKAIVDARRRLEAELRAVEGDETFEIDQGEREAYLVGINEGLLLRSLVVAVAD